MINIRTASSGVICPWYPSLQVQWHETFCRQLCVALVGEISSVTSDVLKSDISYKLQCFTYNSNHIPIWLGATNWEPRHAVMIPMPIIVATMMLLSSQFGIPVHCRKKSPPQLCFLLTLKNAYLGTKTLPLCCFFLYLAVENVAVKICTLLYTIGHPIYFLAKFHFHGH